MLVAALLQVSPVAAQEASGAPLELSVPERATASSEQLPATIPAQWLTARVSLSLEATPLQDALEFLSMGHGLKFGYGTLPDVFVHAEFEDAPLLPALQELLHATGFEMRLGAGQPITDTSVSGSRQKPFIWIFRHTAKVTEPPLGVYTVKWTPQSTPEEHIESTLRSGPFATSGPATGWTIWGRSFAPPAGWILPAPAKGMMGTRFGDFTLSTAGWNAAILQPSAAPTTARNGDEHLLSDLATATIAVARPEGEQQAAQAGEADETHLADETYVRWMLPVRMVPRGAQLLLVLPQRATLTVNGAPLFRRRSGIQRLDISRLMTRGENCLALHFEKVSVHSQEPLFRYAWVFPEIASLKLDVEE